MSLVCSSAAAATCVATRLRGFHSVSVTEVAGGGYAGASRQACFRSGRPEVAFSCGRCIAKGEWVVERLRELGRGREVRRCPFGWVGFGAHSRPRSVLAGRRRPPKRAQRLEGPGVPHPPARPLLVAGPWLPEDELAASGPVRVQPVGAREEAWACLPGWLDEVGRPFLDH